MRALLCLSIVLFSLTSCANPWLPRPRQADAETIVWRRTYGEANRPPTVAWKTTGLDCARGTGWTFSAGCISGTFSAADWSAGVAWPSGVTSYAATAYAHELLHAHLRAVTGDQDDGHKRPEWGTLLPRANAALTAAEL